MRFATTNVAAATFVVVRSDHLASMSRPGGCDHESRVSPAVGRFVRGRRLPGEGCRIESGSETIECPIVDDLDPGGWDLRKALGLLRKSNGSLIEWLHSPIAYRVNETFLNELRGLVRAHLSRKGLANHYRGLAHRTFKVAIDVPEPTAKAYLYCLRETS